MPSSAQDENKQFHKLTIDKTVSSKNITNNCLNCEQQMSNKQLAVNNNQGVLRAALTNKTRYRSAYDCSQQQRVQAKPSSKYPLKSGNPSGNHEQKIVTVASKIGCYIVPFLSHSHKREPCDYC